MTLWLLQLDVKLPLLLLLPWQGTEFKAIVGGLASVIMSESNNPNLGK